MSSSWRTAALIILLILQIWLLSSSTSGINGETLTTIRDGKSLSNSTLGSSARLKRPSGTFLKWFAASALVAVGTVFVYSILVPDVREIRDRTHYYSDWRLRAYCSLPWNAFSRLAGGIANTRIPVFLRSRLLGAYVSAYDCRMDEALIEDLSEYPTFAAFFNRKLKPIVRPISDASLVSPADGVVVHYGKVENGRIEFVKGHDYEISEFLGPVNFTKRSKREKEGRDLYQIVIYLAPGNYHAFHAPARWVAEKELHFPGLLLSVRPSILNRLPRLFCLNERVVIRGHWKHGFFSLSAVAATNVGDVMIDADPNLRTNVKRIQKKASGPVASSVELNHAYLPGDRVGEFKLGSAVVLVFEAPPSIEFAVKAGDQLRYGQSLVKCGV